MNIKNNIFTELSFDTFVDKLTEYDLINTKEFNDKFNLKKYADRKVIDEYNIKNICLFINSNGNFWINKFREFLIDYVNKYASFQTELGINEIIKHDFNIIVNGEEIALFKNAKIIEPVYETHSHKYAEYAVAIIDSEFGLFGFEYINYLYNNEICIEDVDHYYKIYDVNKRLVTKYEYDIKYLETL